MFITGKYLTTVANTIYYAALRRTVHVLLSLENFKKEPVEGAYIV